MKNQEDAAAGVALRLARFLSSNRPFVVVWLALFIGIAGIAMVSPLLPVFAKDMGAKGIWVGLMFSGFAFSQIPLMPLVGRLSDRFGKPPFLRFGLLIYAATAAGYYWSPSYEHLFIFRVLSGVGAAMVIPTAFAYIGELAPRGYEGRYMGLFNIAMIAGFGIGLYKDLCTEAAEWIEKGNSTDPDLSRRDYCDSRVQRYDRFLQAINRMEE